MATNPECTPYSDDSSEDIHILSSDGDIVPENESVNIEPEHIGSGTSHKLSSEDLIFMYSHEFYLANQNFVDDFLKELHHRQDLFKSTAAAQPQQ